MMPSDQVMLTIAQRTKVNLDFIYAKKDSGDVYEFTQLVNSMLSLVISMRAEYFSDRKTVTWEQVSQDVPSFEASKIRQLKKITGDSPNANSPCLTSITHFSELIDKLRNAFAHCCFELVGDSDQQIKGIKVWNVRQERDRANLKKRVWQAQVSETQLHTIAYLFIAYLEATRGHELAPP